MSTLQAESKLAPQTPDVAPAVTKFAVNIRNTLRFVVAGREISALLRLSDQELARRGMIRETVVQNVRARRGL